MRRRSRFAGVCCLWSLVLGLPAWADDSFGLGDGHRGALVVDGGTVFPNFHTSVTSAVAAGATTVFVSDTSRIGAQDLVMLLQVGQSGVLATSGDQAPVSLSSNGVGSFELARVAAVSATRVTLASPLTRAYSAGTSQLVTVPEYSTVTVAQGSALGAQPWDGRQGGVLAFLATGAVTVDGEVNVSGAGFRGGAVVNGTCCPSACIGLDEPSPLGGQKGEGIALGQYGPSFTGYGNMANGAGGGVCHNRLAISGAVFAQAWL